MTAEASEISFEEACDRLFALHAAGFNPREAAARQARSRSPLVASRVSPRSAVRVPAQSQG